MASEIKVDTIVNAGGDNDTGIDLATNDVVKVNIAGAEKARVDSSGRLLIGTTTEGLADGDDLTVSNSGAVGITIRSTDSGQNNLYFSDATSGAGEFAGYVTYEHSSDAMRLGTAGTERMRIDSSGNVIVSNTSLVGTGNNTAGHIELREDGTLVISRNAGVGLAVSRGTDDGEVVQIQQAGTKEGDISVSGSTVSFNGFTGLHESSGIATNTAKGTILSTIDELDVYSDKQTNIDTEEDNPKAGQTRVDHPKVKVSDTVSDSAVYGVVGSFNPQGKVMVASVGVGSIRVTGACAKGDLLESNGDGTAKVQSDDIVRSKTIGKVTIGNSGTGVKLVSCVLYCG